MFCGVVAFWKLESKCKRLLWTEYYTLVNCYENFLMSPMYVLYVLILNT